MTTTVINLKKGPDGHSLIREYGPRLEHAPKGLVKHGTNRHSETSRGNQITSTGVRRAWFRPVVSPGGCCGA